MPRRRVATTTDTVTSPTAASPAMGPPQRGRKRKEEEPEDPTKQMTIPREGKDKADMESEPEPEHEHEHEHEADKENQPQTQAGGASGRGKATGRGKGKGKGKGTGATTPRGRAVAAKRAKTKSEEPEPEPTEPTAAETEPAAEAATAPTGRGRAAKRAKTETETETETGTEQEQPQPDSEAEEQATTPTRGRGRGRGRGRAARGGAAATTTTTTSTTTPPTSTTSSESPSTSTTPRGRGRKRKTDESEQEKMEPSTEHKSKSESETDMKPPSGRTAILEKGRIYFFYRPKVDSGDHVRDFGDIQRLYVLLSPIESEPCDDEEHQGEHPSGPVDEPPPAKFEGPITRRLTQHLSAHFPHRLILIPTKRLPAGGRPIFAFVDRVSYSMDDIESNLDPIDYVTKTRGKRHTGSARPAGEGIYTLIKHAHPPKKPGSTPPRPHVELVYELEVPEPQHMGAAQSALNIQREGRMVIQVKNPSIMTSTGRTDITVPHVSKAGHPMPHHLQQLFAGKRVAQTRFIPCDPPEFLNVEKLEFLLAGVHKDTHSLGEIAQELIDEAEREEAQEKQAHHGHPEERVMEEVHLSPKRHRTESLTTGQLV